MNSGETSGGLAGQAGDGQIEGSDLMDAEAVGGPNGAGSNLPSLNSSRTSATSLDPSTAPGTSALKALVGQAGIVAVERKLRKDLARIYSAADRLLPQGQRLYRRDQKGEITSIDCDIRRSNEIAEALKEKGTEIAPPVSLLLPLVSLITWAPIYLHSSSLATQRYLLPLSSLERSDIVDLVDADLLTEKASPSSTPLHLFFLPNSTDPFSSFTADPSHPQVSPWYTPSTSVPSSELSTPNFDPFTSLALPDSSRSTSRTISSRSRRSKDTTSSQTRTEKAAQVPRTTRNLTPDPSTTNNRTKSKKRSRGREEEGSEDEESVRKVRKVACSEACLAARELEKLEWEQERTTIKQIQERSQSELEQMEEELRRARAEKQNVQDQLDASYRSLTVLGAKSNAFEIEVSQLKVRIDILSHNSPIRPPTSEPSPFIRMSSPVTPERTTSTPRKFPAPDPVKINARRKANGLLTPQVSESVTENSSTSNSLLQPPIFTASYSHPGHPADIGPRKPSSDVDFSKAKGSSTKKKRNGSSPFSNLSLSATPTPTLDSPASMDPSTSPASHHAHDWAQRGIRTSLGVPARVVLDPAKTIYYNTGDKNLQRTPFYPVRGATCEDEYGNPQEGFLAAPRFDPDDKFVQNALSLRQTPGEVNGVRQADAFKRILEDCPRFQMDAYACSKTFKKPWKTKAADKWATQLDAEANLVFDRASYTSQKSVVDEVNERFKALCREAKLKDAERDRLKVTIVETSHIAKQHGKRVVGYSPKRRCLLVWNPTCNLSTCGHALDKPDSNTVPSNCTYETSSLLFIPLGTYAADHELDELDKFNFGLHQRRQFVLVLEELVIVGKEENDEVKKKRKELDKAKEKAAKEHRDSLVDNFDLLDSFAPPPLPDDALTFSIVRPEQAVDSQQVYPPTPTEPFCHRIELASKCGELKEGNVAGLLGCTRCGGFAGRTFSQTALKEGSRSAVKHPQTEDEMEYNPFCPAANSLGSPLFVISADEVAARGTWETVMREEFQQIQNCKLASSKCPLLGLIFEWYSSLTRDLEGFDNICANGLAFFKKLEHPEKPYLTKLCDGSSNHNLSRLLHSELGPRVYFPAGPEKTKPRIRARLIDAVADHQVADAIKRTADRSGSSPSNAPAAPSSSLSTSDDSQPLFKFAATSIPDETAEEDDSEDDSEDDAEEED